MSNKVAKAWLVSVPNFLKGKAGAGFWRRWVKSLAVSSTKSVVEVTGTLTR